MLLYLQSLYQFVPEGRENQERQAIVAAVQAFLGGKYGLGAQLALGSG